MVSSNKSYDIVLLYTQFRVHNYYTNIIRQLSGDFSIGIYDIKLEHTDKAKEKVIQTDQMFLTLCQKLGADILGPGQKYACNLLLAPQHNYLDNHKIGLIDRNKTIAFHRFGSGSLGLTQLKDIGAEKIWVYEKKTFLDTLIGEKKSHLKDDFEIEEMGSPYARYPVFDFSPLNIDYIIAYPTPMLIREPQKKSRLLENMYALIDSIPDEEVVCIKLHNVMDGGYVLSQSRLLKKLGLGITRLLDRASSLLVYVDSNLGLKRCMLDGVHKFRAKILGSLLEDRAVLLSDISEYYNFGIEHFIPFVKKGVITGISSCIWHSLYNRLPVYNCDDQALGEDTPNCAVYKNFYVPPCRGNLYFDWNCYDMVNENSRKADLIKMIKKEL